MRMWDGSSEGAGRLASRVRQGRGVRGQDPRLNSRFDQRYPPSAMTAPQATAIHPLVPIGFALRQPPRTCQVDAETGAMGWVRNGAMMPSVMPMAIEIAAPWAVAVTVIRMIAGAT